MNYTLFLGMFSQFIRSDECFESYQVDTFTGHASGSKARKNMLFCKPPLNYTRLMREKAQSKHEKQLDNEGGRHDW
jgi:hypothetical protein